MIDPALRITLTRIRRQRATLAKMRAEAEDLDDYLQVMEARARDSGERIPMATVHQRLGSARKPRRVAVR